MNEKSLAFSAMFISVALFLIIGFLMYYPIYVYYNGNNFIGDSTYRFFAKSSILTKAYTNKLLLFSVITGATLLYSYKRDKKGSKIYAFSLALFGILMLLASDLINLTNMVMSYFSMFLYIFGFIFSLIGITKIRKIYNYKDLSEEDPFNDENETFAQTTEKIETKYSVNIPYEFIFKKKINQGWINFVNLFRALLIIGTPGSGKSFALIEEIIEQFIAKAFTLLVYDFKFDTLSKIAYNYLIHYKEKYKNDEEKMKLMPQIYFISFDNMKKTHRCNPIDPYLMKNQSDASNAASTLLKNLNKEWIKKMDFFSRSALSFGSGLIWYLKNKSEEHGKNYCTLPHVIILSTVNLDYLLKIMLKDVEVKTLMIPFKDALEREANQQLAGQTASAQISLSSLANKEIFYVMSGNDFRLDLNNPEHPKILCLQNNPDRSEIYSAPLGLYINKILQVVNQKGKRPLGLILDELPTIFIMGLRKIIDTGRSNLVATVLGIQSLAQLITEYSKEQADVLFDNCANIFCGSAKGETASRLSKIFGKIHQKKVSKTISKQDVTSNESTVMQELLPESKIASMSTGHFAGIVADEFQNKIEQKLCYGLVKPNMESKKFQNKHDIPIINDFKNQDHDIILKNKLNDVIHLNLYNNLKDIDFDHLNYIDFYNDYALEFSKKYYNNEIDCNKFIAIIKEIKLYDNLAELKKLYSEAIEENIIKFINFLVEESIINTNMDKILTSNFIQILKDVEELVKIEYYNVTGEYPEHRIFDENKINDNMTEVLSKEEELTAAFMNAPDDELEFDVNEIEDDEDELPPYRQINN
ncbi:hypothetical protein FHS04_002797 [Mesoflavibacter sabulilitoris]|uniref:TraD/TraG TraM recognition site domain-containing protein n=1 Tax=Mesoflavibacter zeaxanthinifaciens subsp. sabulilitoris TaxID=1520893 RepID=A0A2T1NNM0_9FLAO|nr:TraM recognition domain-containing protein [Mesoflavibacter zeaxanthinifaciens]MBB3125253.1 hypothetical protein [Mesoflavibacter zeaxanthinifaciens subsp. sabulilitoris]PSG94488.1 hypothetical protein C7H61_00715 [Mesoflavibacter zeaxanthinifaciens subsp. sabulilitoris]